MSKNYGLPYMGSKSGIVHLIRYVLERHYDKKYFIDVFCGGFAVSHYVLEKTQFKVLANDKNRYVVALIEQTLKGLPDSVYDFITRETFLDVINNPIKYDDWYVGYVSTIWSFGNTQKAYMFGKDVEPLKHSMHNAIVFNKWDDSVKYLEKTIPNDLKELDYKAYPNKRTKLMTYVKRHLKDRLDLQQLERLQQLEQLQRLERLQQLQQLQQLERLQQLAGLDWRDFINSIPPEILENAIIYCDPPYEDTAKYAEDTFSHQEFWQWFRETPYCVYVSSYKAPDDIKPLNFELKNQMLSGGVGKKVKENIYYNGKGEAIPTMEDMLFGL